MNKHFLALCIIFLLLAFSADYAVSKYEIHNGVRVVSYFEESPAKNSGIMIEETITAMNGAEIKDISDFKNFFSDYKTGDSVSVNGKLVILGDNAGKPLFGANVENSVEFPYYWVFILSGISSILPWISAIFGGLALFSKEHSFLKLNALNAFDIILTGIALLQGARELNPFAQFMISNFGFFALAIFKALAVVMISKLLLTHKMHKSMQICVFVYAGIALVNITRFAHTMFL